MNLQLNYDKVKALYRKSEFKFYDSGKFNVNLFGIRNRSVVVDEWNDALGIAFRDDYLNGIMMLSKGSTKPGLYWLKNKKGNINGTAILIPDYYPKCWKIGEHKGYEALQQAGPGVFKVWRDNDQDGELDYNGKVYTDVTGLNMHTESLITDTERVGAYSAGCQVRADTEEHFAIMNVLKKAAKLYGNLFSYALFEEKDVISIM